MIHSGWNWTPSTGVLAVAQAHDQPILGPGGHLQAVGQVVAADDQRVVAGGLERLGQAGEHARAAVVDRRELAVHHVRRAHHRAAIGRADRLVAQADAQDRHRAAQLADQRDADAGLVRRTRPRRDHDLLRRQRRHIADAQLVVALHQHIGAQLAQILVQVVGERVVVVE